MLKQWKISPIDDKALDKWDDYSRARDKMLLRTNDSIVPWTVVRADDKRATRLAVIKGTGDGGRIAIEVLEQRDARHVRGIALTSTQGLARGMAVEDTGGPLQAPVGKGVLSRMFDVFGNTIDRGAAPSDVQWRSVHRAQPPLARRSTKSEIFEAGHQGH